MPMVPWPAITSGIVEGMDEGDFLPTSPVPAHGHRRIVGTKPASTTSPPRVLDRVDLDLRRGHRHHDHRAAAELLRRQRHALAWLPAEAQITPILALRRRQVGHLVVGAAQLGS